MRTLLFWNKAHGNQCFVTKKGPSLLIPWSLIQASVCHLHTSIHSLRGWILIPADCQALVSEGRFLGPLKHRCIVPRSMTACMVLCTLISPEVIEKSSEHIIQDHKQPNLHNPFVYMQSVWNANAMRTTIDSYRTMRQDVRSCLALAFHYHVTDLDLIVKDPSHWKDHATFGETMKYQLSTSSLKLAKPDDLCKILGEILNALTYLQGHDP